MGYDMLEALLTSLNKKLIVLPENLGPGPQILITGNASAGFFGETPGASLISTPSLMALHKPTQGKVAFDSPWFKFILDGKILYVSRYAAWANAPWTVLNAQGIIAGKQITIGDNTYLHRALKSDITDPTTINSGYIYYPGNNPKLDRSEWGRLMFPILASSAGGSGTWAQYTKADLIWNAADTLGNVSIVAERPAGATTQFITMGGFTGAGNRLAFQSNSANWMGHRPVLELQQ